MSSTSAAPTPTSEAPTTFSLICEDVVEHLSTRYPDVAWSVSRVDDRRQVHLYSRGDLVVPGYRLAAEQSMCRRMLDGAPRMVSDASDHPVYGEVARPLGIRGYVGTPLLLGRREAVGGLCGFSTRPLHPDEVDEDLVGLLGRTVSRALELTRRNRSLDLSLRLARDEAATDELTGLLNRRGWQAVLAEADRRARTLGDRFCVVVLDLDDLKGVNDRDGHAAGDDLLVRTARSLEHGVRAGDAVARTGGDEFVLLVETVDEEVDAEIVGRMRARLEQVGVSASVGHAALEHGVAHEDVVVAADRAMYADKQQRREAAGLRP